MLPDEPADHPDAAAPQFRKLLELVVLIAEDDLDRVLLDPGDVLVERRLEGGRLGDVGLIPDASALKRPAIGPFSRRGLARTKLRWPSESTPERR